METLLEGDTAGYYDAGAGAGAGVSFPLLRSLLVLWFLYLTMRTCSLTTSGSSSTRACSIQKDLRARRLEHPEDFQSTIANG